MQSCKKKTKKKKPTPAKPRDLECVEIKDKNDLQFWKEPHTINNGKCKYN